MAAVVHGGIAYVSGQVSREGQQVIAGRSRQTHRLPWWPRQPVLASCGH